MQKILIIEDEQKLSSVLARYLQAEGFVVEVARDGVTGLAAARGRSPSLVILDLMLPGMNGLDVCRDLRKTSDVPVIMLTAKAEEADKIAGLETGADDYLTKPFSLRELVSRIRAVLRRYVSDQPQPRDRLECGDIVLDTVAHTVMVRGKEVSLTPAEFRILALLMGTPGRAFSRLEILDCAFGDAFEGYERTVDTHVLNLRKKMEADPSNPVHLVTVYGIGYRMSQCGAGGGGAKT